MFWTLADPQAGASAHNSDEVATNYCLDAITDWITSEGHYDARTARNCDATGSSTRGGSYWEPDNFRGRSVNGLQKAAGCRYNQYATTPPDPVYPNPHYDDCEYIPPSVNGCYFNHTGATSWMDMSHMVWLRREDGTLDFNDGGFEQRPDA